MASKKKAKASAKKSAKKSAAKSVKKPAKSAKKSKGSSKSASKTRAPAIEFNHAMIYTADYLAARAFYCDQLGFEIVEEYPGEGYGRVRAPGGNGTLALHSVDGSTKFDPLVEGVRLYFEVPNLDEFCAELASRGVMFAQEPQDMPWGWRHAFLRDPDGHELSLYRAGQKRFQRSPF